MTPEQMIARHSAIRYTSTARMHPPTLHKTVEILDDLKRVRGKSLTHVWGYDPNKNNKEHHTGRALDFMVFKDLAAGDHIADYVIKHQKRLGLIHVIWKQRIYRGPHSTSSNPKGVWQKMKDRGNATQNHFDHPHVWFAATPYQAPGEVREPTVLTSLLVSGARSGETRSRGPEVVLLQRMLSEMDGARLILDGSFGPATEAAVKAAQRKRSLTADGRVGPATRTRLNTDWSKHKYPSPTPVPTPDPTPPKEPKMTLTAADLAAIREVVRSEIDSIETARSVWTRYALVKDTRPDASDPERRVTPSTLLEGGAR